MPLEGRHVLVTGASRGIGEGLARRFAAAGARVALAARSAGALRDLAAELGGTAHPVDLADPAQLDGFVARVEDAAGPVDVLVNNAGIDVVGALDTLGADDVARLVAVNLTAPMELTRQIVPRMAARGGGRIVFVGSVSSATAVPGLVPYAATKAGLSLFARALPLDLAGTGVRVRLVELGPVPTGMLDGILAYPPARTAVARLERLGLSVDTPLDRAVDAVVAAATGGRPVRRVPVRMGMWAALGAMPSRVARVVLAGISRPPTPAPTHTGPSRA